MKPKKAQQSGSPPAVRGAVRERATGDKQEQTRPEVAKSSTQWWGHPWLFGLLVVVATIVAYQPAWHGGFIWDDDIYVTDNPLLTAPDGWQRIWFSRDAPSQYFPLTY